MPSTHDDSSGSHSFSTPRSAAPGIRGNSGPTDAAWLGNYLADRMTSAGIDAVLARRVADEMQPDIVAAFATLARLESPLGIT